LALNGRPATTSFHPLSGAKRKWDFGAPEAAFDPQRTRVPIECP